LRLVVGRDPYVLMKALVGGRGRKRIEYKDAVKIDRYGNSVWDSKCRGRVYVTIVVYNANVTFEGNDHFVCKWLGARDTFIPQQKTITWLIEEEGREFQWTLTRGRWWEISLGEIIYVFDKKKLTH
jgi:hypothetical protein